MPPPRRKIPQGPDPLPGQRSRGALIGLAVGDALGAPLRGRNFIAPLFPKLADGPRRTMAVGKLKSRIPPAQNSLTYQDFPEGIPGDVELEPPVIDLRRGQ